MHEMIDQQIPTGLAYHTVLAKLDSMGIEHSPYDVSERRISAIIRNTAQHGVVRTSQQIKFFFDEVGHLERREHTDVHTGP